MFKTTPEQRSGINTQVNTTRVHLGGLGSLLPMPEFHHHFEVMLPIYTACQSCMLPPPLQNSPP